MYMQVLLLSITPLHAPSRSPTTYIHENKDGKVKDAQRIGEHLYKRKWHPWIRASFT